MPCGPTDATPGGDSTFIGRDYTFRFDIEGPSERRSRYACEGERRRGGEKKEDCVEEEREAGGQPEAEAV